MIEGYSDHAANERTFLAWVRTGIAVIALGLVIEKFNLFMEALTMEVSSARVHAQVLRSVGALGRYEGLAFILGGVALIMFSTVRFVRTTSLLEDKEPHSIKSVRAELIVSAVLVLLVASYSIYLAIPG
jgi:putative membrane protein